MMNTIISPQQAYELVQQGNFNSLRSANISKHFTWAEVFTNCNEQEIFHCPQSNYDNALKQATVMEKVRDVFQTALIVHAWYRGPIHNRRVGGAPKSQHLRAAATDFHVLGFEGVSGNTAVQKKLDPLPFMQVCGLEFTRGPWTHVDSRGVKARFGV